jgi:hypothetical protein
VYSSGVLVVPWRRINLETVPSIYRALDATLAATTTPGPSSGSPERNRR